VHARFTLRRHGTSGRLTSAFSARRGRTGEPDRRLPRRAATPTHGRGISLDRALAAYVREISRVVTHGHGIIRMPLRNRVVQQGFHKRLLAAEECQAVLSILLIPVPLLLRPCIDREAVADDIHRPPRSLRHDTMFGT
jgi:hypothetical protein